MNSEFGWFEDGDDDKEGKYVGEIKNGEPSGQGHSLGLMEKSMLGNGRMGGSLVKEHYLHFSKDIKKRKSVVIDFKGGNGSVYSEIALQFSVKF